MTDLASPSTAPGHTYGDIFVHGAACIGDRYNVSLPPHILLVDHRLLLIESLRFPEINARLNTIAEPHSWTFEWLFKDDDYRVEWHSFIQLYGLAPGWRRDIPDRGQGWLGKSTSTKFILKHPSTQAILSQSSDRPVLLLCHCFCSDGSEMQKTTAICSPRWHLNLSSVRPRARLMLA